MINSRSLDDLVPEIADKVRALLAQCEAKGLKLLVTSTFRDAQAQDATYAQGRTTPGIKVTNAPAGYSWHNFRCAADVVPVIGGKLNWSDTGPDRARWDTIGEVAKAVGLEWGGDWTSFKDMPHVQDTQGLTLAQLRAKYGKERPKTW